MMAIDGASGVFTNTADQAAVRVVHVSAATPALDVYRATVLNAPLFSNLAFRDHSAYASVPDWNDRPAGRAGGIHRAPVPVHQGVHGPAGVEHQSVRDGAGQYGGQQRADRQPAQHPDPGRRFRFLIAAPSRIGSSHGLDIYVTTPGLALDFTAATSVTTDDAAQFKRGDVR